jgi:hypothetical protein
VTSDEPGTRSTAEALRDHLRLRTQWRIDEDLERNYAEEVVVLSTFGQFRGREAMQLIAQLLRAQFKESRMYFDRLFVDREFGFLEWRLEASDLHVPDGADSYVVRDGLIVAHTIHYTVRPNAARF